MTARRRHEPADAASADAVLSPRSIALVGVSERTYFGRNIFRNLREHRFPGPVHLVNARRSTVFGEPAVPSLRQIGAPVDQAMLLAGQEHLASLLDDCVSTGVKSAVILSSLDPADVASGRLREALDRRGAEHALQVLGPSSLGYINVRDRLPATVTHIRRLPPPGPIAVLSHSGAFMISALRLLEERAAGASCLVSLGNEADLDLGYYLRRAIDDPETRVVCLILEGIRRPGEFMELAARALEAGTVLVALKLGRSDQGKALALSHTGALAGSHEAFDAVCRRFGIVQADDFEALIELAVLLGHLPAGQTEIPRVGVVVGSGGAGLMAADAAAAYGVPLPAVSAETRAELEQILPAYATVANPLDTTAQVRTDAEMFDRAAACFAADENIDVGLFLFALGLPDHTSPSHQASFEQVARLRPRFDKPLITAAVAHQPLTGWGRRFLRRTGVPYVRGVHRAFQGLHAWAEHGRARAEHTRAALDGASRGSPARPFDAPTSATVLDEWSSKQRLAAYGLHGPNEVLAGSLDEALAAARRIGYPVAIKAVSAALPHKAAVGGVALDIQGDDELVARWREMERTVRPHLGPSEPFRVLVAEMVRGGLEILLGVHHDAQFGLLVACGPGGSFAEAIGRLALAVPPLSRAQAWDLLDRSGVGRVLRSEQRGLQLDDEAAVQAVQAVGQLAVDYRGLIESVDINPLMVSRRGQGVRVLDALIVPATPPGPNGPAAPRDANGVAMAAGRKLR